MGGLLAPFSTQLDRRWVLLPRHSETAQNLSLREVQGLLSIQVRAGKAKSPRRLTDTPWRRATDELSVVHNLQISSEVPLKSIL